MVDLKCACVDTPFLGRSVYAKQLLIGEQHKKMCVWPRRSNMGPAKPLTADEIVKANAKKRAAGGQMGAPAKLGRLDAATMAALGRAGSGSGSANLTGQGLSQTAGQGSGQLPGQGSGQFTAQGSGHVAGQGPGQPTSNGSGQFMTQSSRPMPGQSTGLLVPGQAPGVQGQIGRGPGQGLAGPGQPMLSNGSGPALTPEPGPVSPGLPTLSPMGPGGLLSPPSGLGNLFNEEVSCT